MDKPSCRHAVTPMSLLLRLAVVLLAVGALCLGASAQLGDDDLRIFSLACICLGMAALAPSAHAWLDRFLDGAS